MSVIPNFCDGYHLPPGEHECTMEEATNRFVYNPQRERVWAGLNRLLARLKELDIAPEQLLIDGSFVTGRQLPGDVDSGALIPPEKVVKALSTTTCEDDKEGIKLFTDLQQQRLVKAMFGAHMLVVRDEKSLGMVSKIFRNGGDQFGKLRAPDPNRDPSWVKTPQEKGILKIKF
ncbi:DUF6932 family protein [Aneurinibacillus migulanus]|uniref:DUF6932 family protein n=1 Tax=Aneurinibacillus migulanus TaxID=47500 RepID=UPI00209CEB36|nr:hypothetical protein [Aneurinibacillus migulanus]MCP1355526.1 hypothetical protein [Aneurinibacillus migulanus]